MKPSKASGTTNEGLRYFKVIQHDSQYHVRSESRIMEIQAKD